MNLKIIIRGGNAMDKSDLNRMIGERLKRIRLKKGLSLEAVSELTGVSKPMLTQIERALSNPTVSTLWKIAEGLNVPFTAFIVEKEEPVKLVRKDAITPFKEANDLYEVYSVFPAANGRPFEIYTVSLLPGCDYLANSHPHHAVEFIWVLDGAVTIEVNQRRYALSKNEGLRFTADQPHRYVNEGKKQAEIMMVIYYPDQY